MINSVNYPPFEVDFSLSSVKNLDYASFLSKHRLDRGLIDLISYQKSLLPVMKFCHVDLKFYYLHEGERPCLPNWHIDGGYDRPSNYSLMTVGVCNTAFSYRSPEEGRNTYRLDEFEIDYISSDWEIINYNNLFLHQGMPAKKDGHRFLARVMTSNWKPSAKTLYKG